MTNANFPSPDGLSTTRVVSFCDSRPPQEIRFDLEREFMIILKERQYNRRLEFFGNMQVNGAPCDVCLQFDAALPRTNYYTLRLTLSWSELPSDHHAYHAKAAPGWFDLWTRGFTPAPPSHSTRDSPARYAALTAQAVAAETHLPSIESVQEEILTSLRSGAQFSTAHKEGGTVISHAHGRFLRADFGESSQREEFPDTTAFLIFLRKFFDWETARNAPTPPSEYDRWKLILRLLRPPLQRQQWGAPRNSSGWKLLLIALIAIIAGGGFAWLKIQHYLPKSDPPKTQLDTFNGVPPKVTQPPLKDWKPPTSNP